MDYEERKRLEARLPNIIDSPSIMDYCASSDWDRDKVGRLTRAGWQDALKDAKAELASVDRRSVALWRAVTDIECLLEREKAEAESDQCP